MVKRLASLLLLGLIAAVPGHAQNGLRYDDRGDRHEGIKAVGVGAYEIELISLLATYREAADRLPPTFKIRFFLEDPAEVHLTVREIEARHYYWLDRIAPVEPWRPGFLNVFEWPTGEVIQHLKGLGLYDLGIVARLGYEDPRQVERVAPVILHHHRAPGEVDAYLFTLVTRRDARLECSVYRAGEAHPVWTEAIPMQPGGRPFVVRWDGARAAEGPYRLVIDGFRLADGESVGQTVHFYHRPVVDRGPP